MPDKRNENSHSHDAVTTPVGVTTICPQCGVVLDALTTTCGACGAVITGAGTDEGRTERVRSKLQDAIGDAFVLGGLLGRGGMGIVFRARETALDRDVALKVLAFDPILNPDAYARFEREAKLAARLDHPNIVPIFSVGQRNGVAFYTMRMVRGGSVEQMIVPGEGMEIGRAIGILRDVAAALDYAHQNGVVHRDIKPANVLVGDSGHAMVADFGIARAFGGDTGSTATGTGVVGSPAYMSPEQWRGEIVDGRADQYALAILAFELLTGRRPFADASMQELLRMHLAEEPPDIISFRDDLPSHTTDTIWRGMAKDPADRFPSSTAFVDALGGTVGATAAMISRANSASAKTMPTPATRPVKPLTPRPGAKPPVSRTVPMAPEPQESAQRSMWPVAVLLLIVGGLAGAMIIKRVLDKQNAPPAVTVAPAPVVAATDSAALAAQFAQKEEKARLQREVDSMVAVALQAEHKIEQSKVASVASSKRVPAKPVVEAPHAHLAVVVQGGTPPVFVDGEQIADASPVVVEVSPGRHTITVKGRGGAVFLPAEYNLTLAANDTQRVVFMSEHAAQQRQQQMKRNQVGGTPTSVGGPTTPPVSTEAGSAAGTAAAPPVSPPAGSATAPGQNNAVRNGPDITKMTPAQRQMYYQYLRKQARKPTSGAGTP